MSNIMQKALEALDHLGIEYTIIKHEAIYTIEEMEQLGLKQSELVAKNLFLREEGKKRYFLVVMQKNKKVDLKKLQILINSKRLGFGSEQDLLNMLGLQKGSVTAMGVINDSEHKVEVIIDKDVQDLQIIGLHPNVNTATVWISVKDLEKIIVNNGNPLTYIKL